MTVMQRLDALDRRFGLKKTRFTFDEPRPRWMFLIPIPVWSAVIPNLIARHAFRSNPTARDVAQAVSAVQLLLAVLGIGASLRWQRKHRVQRKQ